MLSSLYISFTASSSISTKFRHQEINTGSAAKRWRRLQVSKQHRIIPSGRDLFRREACRKTQENLPRLAWIKRIAFGRVVRLHEHSLGRPDLPTSRPRRSAQGMGRCVGASWPRYHVVLQFLNVGYCLGFARCRGEVGRQNPGQCCDTLLTTEDVGKWIGVASFTKHLVQQRQTTSQRSALK